MNLPEFNIKALDRLTYLGTGLTKWFVLLALALLTWSVARFVLKSMTKRLQRISDMTVSRWDDFILQILHKTHGIFLFFVGLLAATFLGDAAAQTNDLIKKFAVFSIFFQCAIWGNEVIALLLKQYLARRNGYSQDVEINLSAYSAISLTARFILWSILLLLLLDNLGINITALVTGLGIGGIAIALAVQNILGDIFASLSIILDRPFEVGDFIIVGDKLGTVENIGLKTSRIKSLSGEQLVFPNKKLVETDISNYKRMETRRIVFSFGLVYDTPKEKLRQVPQLVREIIESLDNAQFDRAHFSKFSESSLDFEVVYIMKVPDYNRYMDTQQEINFRLFEKFASQGLEFAYPTRTLFMRKEL